MFTEDQLQRLFRVADDAELLKHLHAVRDPAARTKACATALGLTPEQSATLVGLVQAGKIPPVPSHLQGGYHDNELLWVADEGRPTGTAVVVRTRRGPESAAGVTANSLDAMRSWTEPRILTAITPQLAELNAQESADAAAAGRRPVLITAPKLLYADGARQVHEWFPGRHPAVAETPEDDLFLTEFLPELVARFARLAPPAGPSNRTPGGTVADARHEVAFVQGAFDNAWEQYAPVLAELGMPRDLAALDAMAQAMTSRRPVLRHGDVGRHNTLFRDGEQPEWCALDVDLAGYGDWVRDPAWVVARAEGPVPQDLATTMARRMSAVDPRLADGAEADFPRWLLITQANMGIGGLGGTVRRARVAAAGSRQDVEDLIDARIGRLHPQLSAVRVALGDGQPLERTALREVLVRDAMQGPYAASGGGFGPRRGRESSRPAETSPMPGTAGRAHQGPALDGGKPPRRGLEPER